MHLIIHQPSTTGSQHEIVKLKKVFIHIRLLRSIASHSFIQQVYEWNLATDKTFCCIMYCCQIWSQYKKGTVRKLQVGYNHAFRRIMKYDRTCSASGMFVANDVMSFNEIWRKSLYNFRQHVTKSNNSIVNHVFHFTRATSTIWKNCDHILYIV